MADFDLDFLDDPKPFDPNAPEYDRHGSLVQPPNFYQLKHAEREKQRKFEVLYQEVLLAQIDWDEFVAYVESAPPTAGDRLRQHRLRNANILRHKENTNKMRKARGGKQKA